MLFGRMSTVQKFFNDYVSYTSIGTQLRAPSLKISSHSDHKQAIIILLHPGIHHDILKSQFSFKNNLSSLCGLNFSFVWYKFFTLSPKTCWQGV